MIKKNKIFINFIVLILIIITVNCASNYNSKLQNQYKQVKDYIVNDEYKKTVRNILNSIIETKHNISIVSIEPSYPFEITITNNYINSYTLVIKEQTENSTLITVYFNDNIKLIKNLFNFPNRE